MRRKQRLASPEASAPLFAALGDPKRMAIVARLCQNGPLSIARLAEGSNITRQAVTKHLHVLEEAGLVRGNREGRERVWELEPERLDDAKRHLDRISAQWDDAIVRLRNFVER